jgi:hypothetical protein
MIAKGTRGDSSRVVVYNDLWTHHTTDTRGIERSQSRLKNDKETQIRIGFLLANLRRFRL